MTTSKSEKGASTYSSVEVVCPGGLALSGVIGNLILGSLGYGAIASACSLGMIAASCATGAAIFLVPAIVLQSIVDTCVNSEKNPLSYHLLSLMILAGSITASIFIGAAVFGLMANPIGLSVLTSIITGFVVVAGLMVLAGIGGFCLAACFGCDELPENNQNVPRSDNRATPSFRDSRGTHFSPKTNVDGLSPQVAFSLPTNGR